MLILVTPATEEPVSLDEARAHLRVAHDGDNVMIGSLITAAREVVELNTGRALAAADYAWSPESAALARTPLTPATVTSAAGVLPITFTTIPGPVPAALKAAILLIIGDLYLNAEANIIGTIVAANPTLQRLIFPYRDNLGV